MVHISSLSDTPQLQNPKNIEFEVNIVWNFDKNNKRILVLLPPIISQEPNLLLQYPHLLKEIRETLLKLTSMNQTYIIITIPISKSIDIYQLEDICNLEVKSINSLEQLKEPEFIKVISNELLYYIPYNESWFVENKIIDYIDTIIEEYPNQFSNSSKLDVIQGIHYITQISSCIRISALNILNNSFNYIDWIIILGKLTSEEISLWKKLIQYMMDNDVLATIYIIDTELYEILNVIKMSVNKPVINIRKRINKNTIDNIWLNISNHTSNTYTFIAGRFNFTNDVNTQWHLNCEKNIKNTFYDIYSFDTLQLNNLQKYPNVIWYPENLIKCISNDESS